MVNLRKLAAIDIAFLGSKIVIAEFAAGVAFCVALGAFIALRAHSASQIALAIYFILLGINYVPLFFYAVAITRARSARSELGDELDDQRRAMAKYRRQSLLLLIPLLAPILALMQERGGIQRD